MTSGLSIDCHGAIEPGPDLSAVYSCSPIQVGGQTGQVTGQERHTVTRRMISLTSSNISHEPTRGRDGESSSGRRDGMQLVEYTTGKVTGKLTGQFTAQVR